ncbi:hypothetical protein ACFOEK_02680 [Litoribrevibacter euphylliae]|uniref:Uncharacterized protein n=1 Tax=Litoribrevibacter euphylliae TaxID=1834034 RepID=A0ABV7H818_9GAMM
MRLDINISDCLRDKYSEEQGRISELDTRSFQSVVFLTFLILSVVFVGYLERESIFHPVSPLAWGFLAFYLFTVFCLVCAWGHAILAFKLGMDSKQSDIKAIHQLLISSEDAQKDTMAEAYLSVIEALEQLANAKQTNLSHAYSELTISAWLFFGGALIALFIELAS